MSVTACHISITDVSSQLSLSRTETASASTVTCQRGAAARTEVRAHGLTRHRLSRGREAPERVSPHQPAQRSSPELGESTGNGGGGARYIRNPLNAESEQDPCEGLSLDSWIWSTLNETRRNRSNLGACGPRPTRVVFGLPWTNARLQPGSKCTRARACANAISAALSFWSVR